ncbi:MAG TPA: extracellular solute-binding protein [Stellaceae bacterium]|nr:extracellular solute-binding protein [Stellaceae bacterium]
MNGNGDRKSGTRRQFLRGAAAAGGAAIGSGALRGFPTVWAQNIKDVTLTVIGGSYECIKQIADQSTKDLGFKVVMQALDPATQLQRILTQPKSFDINYSDNSTITYLQGKGVVKPVNVKDYKLWDKTLPMFTEGKRPNGEPVSAEGGSPLISGFWESPSAKKFADKPTDWLTMVPSLFNADTLGVRPDLVGGENVVTSWKDLLDPKYKGKTALVDQATIGIMDVAMALQARGDIKYRNMGNMTRAEIDKTIDIITKIKKSGQFRAFWTNFDESVNLMASGEVVVQSMWSPAVTAVRARGIPCYYAPLKEGYRGWFTGLTPMAHLSGLKHDAAIEYINWINAGWQGGFIAKQGYYSPVPETAKKFLTQAEWDYWYEGKPAATEIKDPFGNLIDKVGAVRDGGSMAQRIDHIACWNTVMAEDRYLTRRWLGFIAA